MESHQTEQIRHQWNEYNPASLFFLSSSCQMKHAHTHNKPQQNNPRKIHCTHHYKAGTLPVHSVAMWYWRDAHSYKKFTFQSPPPPPPQTTPFPHYLYIESRSTFSCKYPPPPKKKQKKKQTLGSITFLLLLTCTFYPDSVVICTSQMFLRDLLLLLLSITLI